MSGSPRVRDSLPVPNSRLPVLYLVMISLDFLPCTSCMIALFSQTLYMVAPLMHCLACA